MAGRVPSVRVKNGHWYSEAGSVGRYFGRVDTITKTEAMAMLWRALADGSKGVHHAHALSKGIGSTGDDDGDRRVGGFAPPGFESGSQAGRKELTSRAPTQTVVSHARCKGLFSRAVVI